MKIHCLGRCLSLCLALGYTLCFHAGCLDELEGGTDGQSDSQRLCNRAVDKLRGCSLFTEGASPCDQPSNEDPTEERCVLECVAQTTDCAVLDEGLCKGGLERGGALNQCVTQCLEPFTTTCADGIQPLFVDKICNGIEECDDRSDEADCDDVPGIRCADSGAFVPQRFVCDGFEDCSDGTDEPDCPPGTVFSCGDGETIPNNFICDEFEDCSDGSDEIDCPEQPERARLNCPDEI